MRDEQVQGALQQFFSGRNFMPGGHAGGMRQWNDIVTMPAAQHRETSTDHFLQPNEWNKTRDGESAHCNNEFWPQNFEFVIHPRRAILNFLRVRNTIAATGRFARKAATHRSEVDRDAHFILSQSAGLVKPIKQCAARGVGKWTAQDRFPDARCLSDDHYATDHCAAGNRRWKHARTSTALDQLLDVFFETSPTIRSDETSDSHSDQRRNREKIKLKTMLMMMQVTIGK